MTDHSALIERLEGEPGDCPFCGRDPYHYVDNGVGMERVAVTCCDEGIAYFQHGDPVLTEQVALRREAASALRDLTEWRDIADHDNSATEVLVMAEGWSKPIVAWRHHPSSRTDKWLSVPGAYRVKPSLFCPLPSAPNQEKEAGE